MSIEFQKSETKQNLMRAFTGESQARNRYTFAAGLATKQKQHMIADVLLMTANQEKEHAEIFYQHLKEFNGQKIEIDGTYPVDVYEDLITTLKTSSDHEFEEANEIYPYFAEIAKKEGFLEIAQDFLNIASIEKIHGRRFLNLAKGLEEKTLYHDPTKVYWMCLNCGYVLEAGNAPESCPVCDHDQGYFIRLDFAPYTNNGCFSRL